MEMFVRYASCKFISESSRPVQKALVVPVQQTSGAVCSCFEYATERVISGNEGHLPSIVSTKRVRTLSSYADRKSATR